MPSVEIEYQSEIGNAISIFEKIKDVYTKNSEEFMLLGNGESIRLDNIISVGGEIRAEFGNGENCKIK